MPSEILHIAVAGLIATSLLGDDFGLRAFGVVTVATFAPDLDTFIGLVFPGTHRAMLHNVFVPLLLALAVYYDTRRENGFIKNTRLAWVAVVSLAAAGIGLDLFFNGVNLFYPLHDAFYSLSGEVYLSNQRGIIQTVLENPQVGTTETMYYRTGVNPVRGAEPENVERVFLVATSGVELAVSLIGFGVVGFRLWENR
ncbi:MAG: metal-dependent hydrolase [Halobacteria archaeon]|nr:metal-dependent hydrolase [Halobacteria archaeon]